MHCSTDDKLDLNKRQIQVGQYDALSHIVEHWMVKKKVKQNLENLLVKPMLIQAEMIIKLM